MNCVACGLQLPPGAASCPRCGSAAPTYVGEAQNVYDSTVISTPSNARAVTPSTNYGIDSYRSEPPPPPAFGNAQQGMYNAYTVPSQPSPVFTAPPVQKKRGKTIGIIIASILLIALLAEGSFLVVSSLHDKNTSSQTNATTTNPYGQSGTLVLSDAMTDNSKGYKWDEATMNGNARCGFVSGTYHVSHQVSGSLTCSPEATGLVLADLTYESKLTINEGNYAGLMIRMDQTKGIGYLFVVGVQGDYSFDLVNFNASNTKDQFKSLRSGSNSVIKKGLKETNLVSIVAKGTTFSVYVNGQYIDTLQDSTYSKGQIAVYGYGEKASDISVSDAQVWKL